MFCLGEGDLKAGLISHDLSGKNKTGGAFTIPRMQLSTLYHSIQL